MTRTRTSGREAPSGEVKGGGTHRQDSQHLRVEEAGHPAQHQQARERRDAQQR